MLFPTPFGKLVGIRELDGLGEVGVLTRLGSLGGVLAGLKGGLTFANMDALLYVVLYRDG